MDRTLDRAPFAPFSGLDGYMPRSLRDAHAWIGRLARRLAPVSLLAACVTSLQHRLRDTLLLNATYPLSWIGPYLVLRLDRIDPVFAQARRGLSFAWRGLDIQGMGAADISARTEELFRLASAHGIAAGAVASYAEPGRGYTMLAAAGRDEYPYELLVPHLLLMAQQVHHSLTALARIQRAALPFTEQQIRILHAMQMGLRDDEIARAMLTSDANVRMHLSRLTRRLGGDRSTALSLLRQYQPLAIDLVERPADEWPSPWQFTLFP